jgi:hypothetical protein
MYKPNIDVSIYSAGLSNYASQTGSASCQRADIYSLVIYTEVI